MNESTDLIFEYMDMKLAPTDAFSAFYSALPTHVRSHNALIRLGILTQQLHEYKHELDIETESGQSSFGEFDVTSKRDASAVKEFANKIESSIETDGPLIINHTQFSAEVCSAVDSFLNTIEDELTAERARLVHRYCDRCGLSGTVETEMGDTNSTVTAEPPTASPAGGDLKADLIDVSKY